LLEALARISPEGAGSLGVEGFDTEILDLSPGFIERNLQVLSQAKTELQPRLADETDELVRQDLQIMLVRIDTEMEGIRLEAAQELPYYGIAEIVYSGLRALLEDRIPRERQQAALVRLKRYTGREEGYEPLAKLAEKHLRTEWANTGRLAPFQGEIERQLSTSSRFMEEIGVLFAQYSLEGYEADYEALRGQIEAYNAFVFEEIAPRARTGFRLPELLYAFKLKEYGVDMPVDELRRRSAAGFVELQNQMQGLAIRIAAARGWPSDNYREVIRALKQTRLEGEAILPFYEQRMKEIEAIIEREEIVTLPQRGLRIRLATEAESAAAPAPFMSPPRLIGNTGEYGEFVLPLRLAGGSEGDALKIDDFTYEAASWPLAAHEGRPGHELQFASVIERGVSRARAIFASNSVNIEGWGLYMEEQMYPYLPLEGQLTTLWSRLVRAARAFLDTGLHGGSVTREDAERVLRDDVVLSEALVRAEIERYTFRAPGQATSYYTGYLRLIELRAETELLMGARFDKKAFHDFVLEQGFLPPALLRQAVLNSFVSLYPE
jgi:hypothetical protein